MGRVKYIVSDFNGDKAIQGALCVVINKGTTSTKDTIYNIGTDGTATDGFIGAGICRYIVPNRYLITINGVVYEFDQEGSGKTNTASSGKELKLATVDVSIAMAGNSIGSNSTTTVSRADGSATTDYNTGSKSIIDSLNARDQFAINALRELLFHIPDPSVLSDSEMNYYCNTAYRWAANMMSASADARSTYTDTATGSSSTTSRADVSTGELASSTEKLLYNIVNALEGTNSNKKVGGDVVTILKDYVKDGSNKVGLKELITAIEKVGSSSKSTVDFSTLITAINTIREVKISNTGLGKDANNPIYISGGGFPSRSVLPVAFVQTNTDSTKVIHDFITFNSSGAVGYSTNAEVAKVVANDSGFKSSVVTTVTGSTEFNTAVSSAAESAVDAIIDAKIKTWINKTKVTINGTQYTLTVS